MNIRGSNQNKIITQDLIKLTVSGVSNNVVIKAHVTNLKITGTGNNVNGLDGNCKVDKLNITGLSNMVNLNRSCSNVIKNVSGLDNKVIIDGAEDNNANNLNFDLNNLNNMINNNNRNVRVVQIQRNNDDGNFRVVNNISDSNINEIMNQLNDFGINLNINRNQNQNQNHNNINDMDINQSSNLNVGSNPEQLSDFDKKKQDLFLEMDEYQYKHIQKYDSRKETSCAICIEDFKGTDIIKAFYKCEHIFHKKCLKDWLQRSNLCPLCKHDLKDDIH